MTSSATLLQAALNRIAVRCSSVIGHLSSRMTGILHTAPSKLRDEWDLFQEEVLAEADRIENNSNQDPFTANGPPQSVENKTQEKLDLLRQKIGKLNIEVEAWR